MTIIPNQIKTTIEAAPFFHVQYGDLVVKTHSVISLSSNKSWIGSQQIIYFPQWINPDILDHFFGCFENFIKISQSTDQSGRSHGFQYIIRGSGFYEVIIHDFFRFTPLPRLIANYLAKRTPIAAIVKPVSFGDLCWGYEFQQIRLLPQFMRSGPGLFEQSCQEFRISLDKNKHTTLILTFFATPAPSQFIKIGGIDLLECILKLLRLIRFFKLGRWLHETACRQMLSVHNQVHADVISVAASIKLKRKSK